MDPVTAEHFERANKYQPSPNHSYEWVWEYTRFSFDWTFQRSREVEDKATSLLKFLVATTAGVWTVFTYFGEKCFWHHHGSYVSLGILSSAALAAISLMDCSVVYSWGVWTDATPLSHQ